MDTRLNREKEQDDSIDVHPDTLQVAPFEVTAKKKEEIDALELEEGLIKGKQITKYFVPLRIKITTGDPTTRIEGVLEINKADNKVKIYADGAWRQLATW